MWERLLDRGAGREGVDVLEPAPASDQNRYARRMEGGGDGQPEPECFGRWRAFIGRQWREAGVERATGYRPDGRIRGCGGEVLRIQVRHACRGTWGRRKTLRRRY